MNAKNVSSIDKRKLFYSSVHRVVLLHQIVKLLLITVSKFIFSPHIHLFHNWTDWPHHNQHKRLYCRPHSPHSLRIESCQTIIFLFEKTILETVFWSHTAQLNRTTAMLSWSTTTTNAHKSVFKFEKTKYLCRCTNYPNFEQHKPGGQPVCWQFPCPIIGSILPQCSGVVPQLEK